MAYLETGQTKILQKRPARSLVEFFNSLPTTTPADGGLFTFERPLEVAQGDPDARGTAVGAGLVGGQSRATLE